MFTCKNSRRAFLITVENKAEFVEMARQIAKKRLATSRAAKVKAGPKQPSAPPPEHLLERRALREELTEEEKAEAVHRALLGIEMTEAA